ncbi:MAG TPA: type II secretion system F family protein [Phycisphaerales bacterium]|nr:type II secretion system F family protein [Phycisphaerales bacterium]
MNFRYVAYAKDGAKRIGVIEAENEAEARELLQTDALFVGEISSVGSGTSERKKTLGFGSLFRPSTSRSVAGFTRQMSVLISSGTPIVQALGAVERQTDDPAWREVIVDLRSRVEEGLSLSEAMSHHPRAFDNVYRAMIAAGESGSGFDEILSRLAKLARQEIAVRNNITGAMVYPALLLTVALGVLVMLSLTVLPRFEELFETLNTPLPASTMVLMEISHFMQSYWWALLIGLIGVVAGTMHWLAKPTGKRFADSMSVRIPVFGKIVREFKAAKVARILGVLLEASVPLLESLEIAKTCTNNVLYAELVEDAEERVKQGESMSDAFSGSPLLSTSVCESIRNGEQTGRVGEVLMNLADIMDEDNEIIVRSLTSILEPMILAVLGVLVGIVALSLFLPLFDLTASTGGG